MIGYLKGKVIGCKDNTLLIENNGIGYEVTCSASSYTRLLSDKQGAVYTYLQVKEDGLALFGFDTVEEKNMFLKLITVSGIGAKMGITILGGMSLKELALSIATSDVKALSKIKGLGKKTAERIIVELRESFAKQEIEQVGSVVTKNISFSNDGENAVLALIGLGFDKSTAQNAVKIAIENGDNTVETIIATALKSMA